MYGKSLYLCSVLRSWESQEGGTQFLFPKVLGHPSSFLGNSFCLLNPVPRMGYMMLNLGRFMHGIRLKVEWYTRVGRVPMF